MANNRLNGTNYDDSGNTIQTVDNQSYVYDAENKMVEAKDANGNTLGTYFYDGDGKRIKKVVPNSEETIFVYDASDKLIAEYSNIVASQQEAKTSYLTNDHLGSPRITTDGNGKVVSRRDFLPFGEEISAGVGGRTAAQGYGPAMPRQKFSKKERDAETGLDYFLARYYSSTQGRFTSPDEYKNGPVEFNELEEEEAAELEREAQADPLYYAIQANPQSINKYVYCYDNPLRFIDPDGHQGVATFNARLIQLGDRLVKTPAGQRVTAEATAAAAVTYAIISGAAKRGVEWFGSGNTVGDSSCPGCTSSQRMGQSLMSNSNSSGQQGNNGQANGSGQGSSGTGSIKPPKPKLTAKERREQDRQRTADAKANPPPRSAKDYDPRGRGKIKTAEDATDQREGLEAASKKKSGIDSKKKTRDREIQKAKEENR